MTVRTTKRTVSFARPFTLDDFSEQFPAGQYAIETDEDLLDGMFFAAYLQGVTVMQRVAERRPGITEPTVINPFQLDAALALDAALDLMGGADDASTKLSRRTQDHPQTPQISLDSGVLRTLRRAWLIACGSRTRN